MSESELQAILNEIKCKGNVPSQTANNVNEYSKIIDSFSHDKNEAFDAFSVKREVKEHEVKHKVSLINKIFHAFAR